MRQIFNRNKFLLNVDFYVITLKKILVIYIYKIIEKKYRNFYST